MNEALDAGTDATAHVCRFGTLQHRLLRQVKSSILRQSIGGLVDRLITYDQSSIGKPSS